MSHKPVPRERLRRSNLSTKSSSAGLGGAVNDRRRDLSG
jgi:hypothetical protein